MLALGVFALAAKKQKGDVFLLATAADGGQVLSMVGVKKATDARAFAVLFNNVARAAAGAEL